MTECGLWFEATDGKRLAYCKVLPTSTIHAVILLGHGMNDHGQRFMHLADALALAGFAVYLPDLRGHGETDSGDDRGFLSEHDGFERVVEDMVEIGDFAAKECGGVPLFFFGHSFGALVGMALAGMYGKYLEGLVLSAPPQKPSALLDFFGSLVVSIGCKIRGLRAPAHLPRSMTFGMYAKTVHKAKTGSDWISRDDAVVAAYEADPKCNFVCSYGFYRDLMHGVRKVYSDSFLESVPSNLPLYLFCGSNDPVIGMKKGFETLSRMLKALGFVDFESKCYEGGGRHESINELNRQEVIADIVDWYSRHIA